MQLLHRFVWTPSESSLADLAALDLHPKIATGSRFSVLTVDESDPRFLRVRECLPADVFVTTTTESTKLERDNARWLRISATGHFGYPQPEIDDFGRALTYVRGLLCSDCGLGAVQVAPFRFARDPSLRPNRMLQLNWNCEVFFTTRETWDAAFRPFGIDTYDVVHHRTGAVLTGVVQPYLDGLPSAGLSLPDELDRTTCSACKRQKFGVAERGVLQLSETVSANAHMLRSREAFGYGASASRAVFVSQALYRRLKELRVRGCSFLPVLSQHTPLTPVAADAAANVL